MLAVTQDRYGSSAVLQLTQTETPEVGAGQVRVRVHAAGLDRGAWHLMVGLPRLVRLAFGVRRPRQPIRGLELAGVVDAVGDGVSEFAPGDPVFGTGDGTFAELAICKADRITHLPDTLTFVQAAALPISATTALQALRDAGRVEAGQRVLITGASGGVGSYAVQLATHFGAQVTGVCSPAKADFVRALGAVATIDYARTPSGTSALDTLHNLGTSDERFDLIIDLAGNRSLRAQRRMLTPTGTLVIAGGEEGGDWIGGNDRQARAALWSPLLRQRLVPLLAKDCHEDLDALVELHRAGAFAPQIDSTFPLANTAAAMDHLVSGAVRGKVVIEIAS